MKNRSNHAAEKRAAQAALDRPRIVIIEVFGGVAEATMIPPGVHVEIIDHDNEQR